MPRPTAEQGGRPRDFSPELRSALAQAVLLQPDWVIPERPLTEVDPAELTDGTIINVRYKKRPHEVSTDTFGELSTLIEQGIEVMEDGSYVRTPDDATFVQQAVQEARQRTSMAVQHGAQETNARFGVSFFRTEDEVDIYPFSIIPGPLPLAVYAWILATSKKGLEANHSTLTKLGFPGSFASIQKRARAASSPQ